MKITLMMIKIFNYLINIIIISFGLFWILLFFFRFFIYVRISSNLTSLDNIYLFIFFIIIYYMQFRMILQEVMQIKKESFFIDFILNFFYWKPLNFFYTNIFKNFPGIGDFLMFICKYYRKFYEFTHPNFYIIYNIITDFIPKNLLLIGFILDIFIFEYFYYLNILIPILMPIIILNKVVLYILKDFCIKNKEILDKIVDVVDEKAAVRITLKTEFISRKNELNIFAYRCILFSQILYILEQLENYQLTFIKSLLNYIFIIIYFSGTIKIILLSFHIIVPQYYYLLFFCFFMFIKFYK